MKTVRLRTRSDDTPEVRKLISRWDVSGELREWAGKLNEHSIPWTTTVDWGKPRKDNVFHPSSLDHSCDLYLWLEYVGAGKKDKLAGDTKLILDAGTLLEHQYQYYQHTRALHEGYHYESDYPVWKHGRLSKIGLGGASDGLMERDLRIGRTILDLRILWEYKTINKDGFSGLRNRPAIKYVRQTQAYMASMNIPLTVILYINRDNSEPRHFFTWYDPELWEPKEARLRKLKRMADDYEEPERTIGKSCRWCKFFEECEPYPVEKPRKRGRRR